jgi:hypothetical protein
MWLKEKCNVPCEASLQVAEAEIWLSISLHFVFLCLPE